MAQSSQPHDFSLKLWPPDKSTRQLLVERMARNLSTESFFSRKYGLWSEEDARECAREIEETCLAAANEHFEKDPDNNAASALWLYSKESSKLMIDALKHGAKTKKDGDDTETSKCGEMSQKGNGAKGGREKDEEETEGEGYESEPELYSKESSKPMIDALRHGAKLKKDGDDMVTSNGGEMSRDEKGAEGGGARDEEETKGERDESEPEETCFAAASEHFEKDPDVNAASALQLCSKEDSKLMIDALRNGTKPEKDGDDKDLKPLGMPFDIPAGLPYCVGAKDTAELLTPLTEKENTYRKICFSNRSFGIDAARVAGPILASLAKQLTDVDLTGFIAGTPNEEALEVMRIFSSALEGCSLRSLDLSKNVMGEEGVIAFQALLSSQKNLEELYLNHCGISDDAAEAISKFLWSTDKLKILHFNNNNNTGDQGAIAISEVLKRSPALEDFRWTATMVGSNGGIALAKALRMCTNLKRLDLRGNKFGVDAGTALGNTFQQLRFITQVRLSNLNLGDHGALVIVNALKDSAPSLEVLEMSGNNISVEAAPVVAACIAEKQLLTILNLADNELKDEGADLISQALEEGHMKLKELDLSTNMIRNAGGLALAVVSKPEFELLNINGNAISREGIDKVNKILKSCGMYWDGLRPLDAKDAEGGGRWKKGWKETGKGDEFVSEVESQLQRLKVEQQ